MSKTFFRFAQNDAKYNVQRVAFLKGAQCQKLFFATREIMQNIMFKGLLSWPERMVKSFVFCAVIFCIANRSHNAKSFLFIANSTQNIQFFIFIANNNQNELSFNFICKWVPFRAKQEMLCKRCECVWERTRGDGRGRRKCWIHIYMGVWFRMFVYSIIHAASGL